MKRLLYIVLSIVITTGALKAQETGVFSQYYLNPVLLNPGATGFEAQHEFILNYRNTWAGFDGSPRTFAFQYHGPVGDRMGLGGRLYSDTHGKHRSFIGSVNYAYKFQADLFDFGAGLSVGFEQLRLASVADDLFLDDTDELLAQAQDGTTLFDASLGIYGEYDDRFFFGVSFPDLIQTRISNIAGSIEDPNEKFNYTLLLGYRFDISDQNFKVEPSLVIKQIRRVPFHVDLNVKLSFLEEQLIAGLTYTASDNSGIGVLLGTRINAFRLYYSYHTTFGDFQQYNNGAHELTLQYTLQRKNKSAAGSEDGM